MPEPSKKVVRKVRTARVADFDDQMWPINCAILILAGFAAGIAIATGDWHADNLLYNTIFRLVLVAVAVVVLFAAVVRLQRKMVRRVQLCILVSLLVHLWLGLVFHQRYIALMLARQEAEAAQRLVEADPRRIVPEYHWENIERPESRHTFEEPVATEAPKATEPEPIQPNRLEQDVPAEKKPQAAPSPPKPQQPNPAEVRQAELTAPRRAPMAAGAQISRQELKHDLEPGEPIAEPAPSARAEELAAQPAAATVQAHRADAPRHERQMSDPAPRTPPKQDAMQPARRVTPAEPRADVPTAPATARRIARPSGIDPPAAAVAGAPPSPAATGSSPTSRIEATGPLAVTRTTANAPTGNTVAAAGAAEFAVSSSPAIARRGQPRAVGAAEPSLTPGASSAPVRSTASGTAVAAAPVAAAMPAPERAPAASAGTDLQPTANARAAVAARGGSVSIPTERPTAASGPVAAASGTPGQVGLAQPARVTRHESIASGISGGGTPSPARTIGRAIAPQATIDAPQAPATAAIEGSAGGSPLEAPAGGQSRQTASLPGSVPAEAMAGAVAAPSTPGVAAPTAAAHRATASQTDRGGTDSSPDASVTVARSQRGVQLPSTAATLPDLPEVGAAALAATPGDAPSGLAEGMTVASRRAAGAGVVGEKTIAAGAAEFGAGSSPIVAAAAGPLRGSGDGVANLADNTVKTIGRTKLSGTSVGSAATVDAPATADPTADNRGGSDATAPRPEAAEVAVGGTTSRPPGGLPVEIAAKAGPGGLSYEPSPQVGIPDRHARPESEVVHPLSRRFLVTRSGGSVSVDGHAQEPPAEAFRQRDPGQRARAIEIYGGTERTERAVEMGLGFFVRCQFPDGHWSLDKLPETLDAAEPGLGQMGSDSAATGMALLTFLGAGYTHQSDKHRATVRRGLDWLVGHQKPNGDLFTGGAEYTWFYSHGIAAIALCEAYGMTRDPALREPAQKAIEFIVAAQSPSRGGWRYEPREETDTSVSGWQLMALKSAQMAGLKVPKGAFDGVSRWLDAAQTDRGARYVYNPNAGNTPAQRPGRQPNLAMTAEGALMRMYLGWRSDNPALVGAANHLKDNLPEVGTAEHPARDAYYWYYATQVMFQMRGDYWEAWNSRLQPLLESSQDRTGSLAGSWNPDAPIRDRWAHAGGRVYVTAMHLLMLEVYYRHLPLFQPMEE